MHVVDDIKTRGVKSTSLIIMGVAVTVTVKCSFCKTVSLLTSVFYRLSITCVTLTIYIFSITTTTIASRCIFLQIQLLAKKTIKISKICLQNKAF